MAVKLLEACLFV